MIPVGININRKVKKLGKERFKVKGAWSGIEGKLGRNVVGNRKNSTSGPGIHTAVWLGRKGRCNSIEKESSQPNKTGFTLISNCN
jgi:hypothetical protein